MTHRPGGGTSQPGTARVVATFMVIPAFLSRLPGELSHDDQKAAITGDVLGGKRLVRHRLRSVALLPATRIPGLRGSATEPPTLCAGLRVQGIRHERLSRMLAVSP